MLATTFDEVKKFAFSRVVSMTTLPLFPSLRAEVNLSEWKT
jgi:hypothetical protein